MVEKMEGDIKEGKEGGGVAQQAQPALDQRRMERIKEIDKLIITIYNYPVFTGYEKKEGAKRALVRMYKKEDQAIKNTILFILHEKLCMVKEYRDFHNFEGMKMRYKEEDANKVRQGIFRRIFDYSGSLDGMFETFDLLGKFDDVFSIKLVSYHLSRYMLVNSFETQLLTEKAISILGESSNTYAVRILLSLAPFFYGKEKIMPVMADALLLWAEKINKIKMNEKERDRLKKEIKKYVEMEEKRVGYYG